MLWGQIAHTPLCTRIHFHASSKNHSRWAKRDRRKERFQSHQAGVIRQPGAFEPCAELETFVSRAKEVCA